ncbi:MAG: PAS domain S-box protein [Isosphaeraceae bacterium]|nr:PAS domain S-box protein [Isosphaeraceae bacterium]
MSLHHWTTAHRTTSRPLRSTLSAGPPRDDSDLDRFAHLAALCVAAPRAWVLVERVGEWVVQGRFGSSAPDERLHARISEICREVVVLGEPRASVIHETSPPTPFDLEVGSDTFKSVDPNDAVLESSLIAVPCPGDLAGPRCVICVGDSGEAGWSRDRVGGLVELAGVLGTKLRLDAEVDEASRRGTRLAAILDASTQVSMITTDLQGTITSFNGGAELLLGYKREEMIGLHTPEIFHDRDEIDRRAAELTRQLGRPIEGFEAFIALVGPDTHDEGEWTYIRKDGVRRRVTLIVTAIRDRAGILTGYLGVAKDITRAANAEAKLREFASLVEHCGDFVATTTHEGCVEYINQAGLTLLGLQRLTRHPCLRLEEVVATESGPSFGEIAARVVAEGTSQRGQGRLLGRPDAAERRVDFELFRIESDFDSRASTKLALILTETTEQCAARERLRDSEGRLRAILESSLDALITIDHRGSIIEFNPAAERIFGHAREDAVGKSLGDLIVPEQYRQAHHEGMRRHAMSGSGPVVGTRIEIEAMRSDGSIFPVELAISPIIYGEGPPCYTASLRDITDRKHAERELRLAKDEADAASRSKSEFLANMSHEVRTPMTAVIGYADMLLDPTLSLQERDQALQSIRRNGAHLLQLINDILDLSKIEAGKMDLDLIAYSPWQVMMEVVSSLRVRSDERGIALQVAAGSTIPNIAMIDPTRLRQILVNLVGNAIKFSRERGCVTIRASVEPGAAGSAPRLEIVVTDQGIGMTPEQISQLFIPFQQGDASTTRRFGGSGLGLSITKRLVEVMSGEITVESRLGRGSRFRVSLPLQVPECATWSRPSGEATVQSNRAADDSPPVYLRLVGRVLLAEDSLDNQRVLLHHLRRLGLVVEVADNGRVAIEKAREGGYDLILMDMQMPELDGYGATSSLRRSGYSQTIIALTAHAMKEDRDRCLRTGCSDYITKPVDPEYLGQVLSRYLPKAEPPVELGGKSLAPPAPIRSEIADDPDFQPLLVLYAESLAEQSLRQHEAMARGDLEALARIVHQSKGSGAMYGYPILTEVSALIERAARTGTDSKSISPLLDWFDGVVDRIRRGLEAES